LSYYLIGVLGERIVADTGWSATLVYSVVREELPSR
jgi:hypothetical protein